MLEQGCQTLESIFGPLLEAVICEHVTMVAGAASPATLQRPKPSPDMLSAAATFAAAAAAAAASTGSMPPTSIARSAQQTRSLPEMAASSRPGGLPPPPPGPAAARGSLEAEISLLGLPLPPLSAATCIGTLLQHEQLLAARFPIPMRKRLETLATAVKLLASDPEALDSAAVLEAHQASGRAAPASSMLLHHI